MMSIPAVTQTWTLSANNHYTFATVIGATQALLFSTKEFLKTTMLFTVKGSASAGTGAMDGVDRWTSASTVSPRNNGAAGSQAWFVLTDGAGIDVCLSFNSASDDIFRLAHSPGGIYVVAGTPNQQPTATDEAASTATAASWVNATASGDRLWHLWCSSDKRSWRCVVGRLQSFQSIFGVERVQSNVYAPVAFAGLGPAVNVLMNGSGLGTGQVPTGAANNTCARAARVHVNGADATVSCGGAGEGYFGSMASAAFSVERTELQAGVGDLLHALGMASTGSNQTGKLCNHLDWWFSYSNGDVVFGDVFENFQLFAAGEGIVLPWDGSTTPQLI